MQEKFKVLMVCLGNICRSPLAHAVLEKKLVEEKLDHLVEVDSAGTGDWHIGHAPDKRSQKVGVQAGYPMSHLKARQVNVSDFDDFDLILAMDTQNLKDLQKIQIDDFGGELKLFLAYSSQTQFSEVPDPYYGGEQGFNLMLTLVEDACQGIVDDLKVRLL